MSLHVLKSIRHQEQQLGILLQSDRGRRPRLAKINLDLITDLESLVKPVMRGDPESPLFA